MTCPTCGEEYTCRTKSGKPTGPHAARVVQIRRDDALDRACKAAIAALRVPLVRRKKKQGINLMVAIWSGTSTREPVDGTAALDAARLILADAELKARDVSC